MRRKQKIMVCAMIMALYPFASSADFDPTTLVQDQLKLVTERGSTLIKQYTGMDVDLMQLANSPDKLGTLKQMGIGYLSQGAMNVAQNINLKKLRQVNIEGIGKAIKGAYVTPEMQKLIGKKMTRKDMVANDVQHNREHNAMINDLQIENLATLYAKSLVRRKAIMDENKRLEEEEKTAMTDMKIIQDAYQVVNERANGRWKSILEANAIHHAQNASTQLQVFRINEAEEAEEEKNNGTSQGQSRQSESNNDDSSAKEFTLADAYEVGHKAYDQGKGVVQNIESGNYTGALAGIAGMSGLAGNFVDAGTADKIADISGQVTQGIYTAQNMQDAAKNGDYVGMLNYGIQGGTGIISNYVGEGTQDVLNQISSGANTVQSGYRSGQNGNWGGVLASAADLGSQTGLGSQADWTNLGNAATTAYDISKSGDWMYGVDKTADYMSNMSVDNSSKSKKTSSSDKTSADGGQ